MLLGEGRSDSPRHGDQVDAGGEQILKGKVASLQRFKDDAQEGTNAEVCGIVQNNFSDLREGETVLAFTAGKLADDLGALTLAKG